MTIENFEVLKDADANLDYSIDWTAWLDGDTIATSTWTAPAASGITLHTLSVVTGQRTVAWMSGGSVSSRAYRVTNHIVTAAGREDDRSLLVTITRK